MQISPSTYAADITTPLLVLHSEHDLRCPLGHGEDMFAILRVLKRDVELVIFPAEGHNLSRTGSPAHRVMRFETILDWFERKLAAVEEPASAVPSASRRPAGGSGRPGRSAGALRTGAEGRARHRG